MARTLWMGLVVLCLGGLTSVAAAAQGQPDRLNMVLNMAGLRVGGSLMPPAGDGWQVNRPHGIEVDLRHAGASDQENSQVEAYFIRMARPFVRTPDYLTTLKASIQGQFAQGGETQLQRLEVDFDAKQTQCVRIHMLQSRGMGDSGRKWYIEQYSLSCGFSALPISGMEVSYFRRYFADHADPAFAEQAKALLDSVVLTDQKP